MIAKITYTDDKYGPLIRRLQSEFANELYNLGVRVDALEKNASTIKFTGWARLRYQANMAASASAAGKSGDQKNSQFYERVHLNMQSDINDNIKFLGTIRGQNDINRQINSPVKTSRTRELFFHKAEFKFVNSNFDASIGRLNASLGQGLIWDGARVDGFLLGYNFGKSRLSAGYLDFAAGAGSAESINVFAANLKLGVTDNINLTAAYMDTINPKNSAATFGPDGYAFTQWAVGANAKLGDFKILGEYIENTAAPDGAQKDGVWGRLQWKDANHRKPGTYAIFADYLKLGNWAIDSTSYSHALSIAGGNGIGRDGAKGWGLGIRFVPAKNVNMDFSYYDIKTYDGDQSYNKSYTASTHFYF